MNLGQKKRNRTTGLLVCFLVLISLDMWLFSAMGYGMARWFAALFLLMGIVLPLENTFYLYIFCFPFSGVLKLSQSSITVLPILNAIIILRLFHKKQVRISKLQLQCFFALLIMQLLCALIYDASLGSIVGFFVNLLFVVCGTSYFSRKQDQPDVFSRATAVYVTALISGVVLCDLFPETMYLISRQKQAALVHDGRFGSVFVEPNEFSQAILVGLGLLMTSYPLLRKRSHRVLSLAALIYLAFSGYRTLSKSYGLTLLILFALFMLMNWYRTGKYRGIGNAVLKMIPGILILSLGIWLLWEYVFVSILENRNTNDLWTGRDNLWATYWDALMQRPDVLLVGNGAGNAPMLSKVQASIGHLVPHNTYLEYLIHFGILGLLLLCGVFAKVVRQNRRKLSTYFVLVLIAFFATAFTISANSNDCLFVVILLMAMPLNEGKDPALQSAAEGETEEAGPEEGMLDLY